MYMYTNRQKKSCKRRHNTLIPCYYLHDVSKDIAGNKSLLHGCLCYYFLYKKKIEEKRFNTSSQTALNVTHRTYKSDTQK